MLTFYLPVYPLIFCQYETSFSWKSSLLVKLPLNSYANIKSKALESAYEKVGLTNPTDIPSREKDSKLKEFLKSLS